MKKEIWLPAAAWLGGVIGFALRRWELAVAFQPELQLMETVTATWLLVGLCALLAVVFLLACRGMGAETEPKRWFYAPSTGYIAPVVSAAFVLMGAGMVGLLEQRGLREKEGMLLLAYGLCLVGGACVLVAGQNVYRGQWTKHTPALFMGPSFATLVWLITCYQDNARQPQVSLYVWQMLSAIAVVLGIYTLVTLAVGRGGARRGCVFSLMAIPLTLVTLADGHTMPVLLVYFFALIYLTAHSWMLLYNASGRPWPERMPQRAEEEDEQNETEE